MSGKLQRVNGRKRTVKFGKQRKYAVRYENRADCPLMSAFECQTTQRDSEWKLGNQPAGTRFVQA